MGTVGTCSEADSSYNTAFGIILHLITCDDHDYHQLSRSLEGIDSWIGRGAAGGKVPWDIKEMERRTFPFIGFIQSAVLDARYRRKYGWSCGVILRRKGREKRGMEAAIQG